MVIRKLTVSRVAVLLALGVASAGCDRAVPAAQARAGEPAPVAVALAPVERGALPRPVRASGLARPKQAQELSFQVGGSVVRVEVEEGQRVKKGQVLARVDPTTYSASSDQASRGLEKAERDLARARALARDGAVAQAVLDDAETAAELARAGARIAGFNHQKTTLVAPADGIVERRLAEPGEVVAPGRPVVAFLGTSRGWVVDVALTDRDAVRVRTGQRATVLFDALPGRPVEASVGDVARLGNPATGTFTAEIALPAELPLEPRSGLVAKVEIERVETPPATVPIGALVDGEGTRAAVFAVREGRATRLPVEVAFFTGDRAALAADLAGHDAVVLRGADQLVDGAAVSVVASEVP